MRNKYILITVLLVLASLSRLLPHAPNFTAVGAMALFAGFYLKRSQAMVLPLIVLFVTDLVLGGHSTMLFVYFGMAMVALMASFLGQASSSKIIGGALAGSLMFFFVTNFGVWMVDGFYSPDWQGLMTSYMMGLPFLKNQIAGDLFFSAVLFGSYSYAQRFLPVARIS
ncbi:MAG: DUF6580 family putative transport protein [Bdellovibrionia bacterium]